ncbi:DUF6479 family protein [Streptomyces parvulus]|uniref:DUF6479 family protein n=1 Tax=Streptomyces parvulus TaxID=146923 RepID=A0A191UTB7_9ACTN|nr:MULTISPECIES: DUF6479 family protein [Streptomyces]ANJ05954.1 hypothetical protein Spa2297_02495 [Streptomyces parvulus]MCC9157619.1 DUF6479 family protein [Streptomyces parvulus]MCE7689878.1 DUF6479 family protein [Streptomyces parvulus]MCQ4194343.1 DUF6479 family protein [Streptomyces parvulus]MZD54900.1 hypothetical protein [Streptomyces sp. SID5606]
MSNTWMDLAAGPGGLGVGLIVAAVVVAALLIGAFAFGSRLKRRESPPPLPEEQPHLPADGPVGEVRERREPDEMPKSDERTLPHDLGHQGSRTAAGQDRPRWDEGGSGAFGSGGPGGRR